MQKQIKIPYRAMTSDAVEIFSKDVNNTFNHAIDLNPWNYEFSGKANFNIAYTDHGILLKFNVIEESILARFTKVNDPVYKDSCVEFFVAFDDDLTYYNFEFNCKGTCLAGFGLSAEERHLLSPKNIREIDATSTFKSIVFNGKEMINWQLTLFIPTSVFQFHTIQHFNGKKAKVNFYKCGDDLPKPHYLSWNPIVNVPKPDFHLPEHFGAALFE